MAVTRQQGPFLESDLTEGGAGAQALLLGWLPKVVWGRVGVCAAWGLGLSGCGEGKHGLFILLGVC